MDEEFQKNVYRMEGSKEFLYLAGFELERLPGPDGNVEDFYVHEIICRYDGDRLMHAQNPFYSDPEEEFKMLRKALNDAKAIRPELDRSLRVLFPADASRKNELPDDFFNFAKPKYRYTLIRVRFPDEIILQGTFNVNEKLRDVTLFIQEALEEPLRPFVLSVSGKKLVNQDMSLLDLELIPGVTLQCDFDWDQPCAEYKISFLKETILALLESV